MLYSFSPAAVTVFCILVGGVVGLSFLLVRRTTSAKGFFAAHGEIPWFVNGVAFAGDYLSVASFLGVCGMVAFYGYDGFLYAIGFLAGWAVALFVIAEPIKRLGKFTFADALDSQFDSRGIRLAAAISTLVVSVFYLVPQMVGAGALMKPLLGLPDLDVAGVSIAPGIVIAGAVVILIVVLAGMVSTTWVQFIKGALLVLFSLALTVGILRRGLTSDPAMINPDFHQPKRIDLLTNQYLAEHHLVRIPRTGGWRGAPYVRVRDQQTGRIEIFKKIPIAGWSRIDTGAIEVQSKTVLPNGEILINGLPAGNGEGKGAFYAVGNIASLPAGYNPPGGPKKVSTGPLGPSRFLGAIQQSVITTWRREKPIRDADGTLTTIYYPVEEAGSSLLAPGNHPMFAGLRSGHWKDRLNFVSLMLALFCGTAALPHILIRYYTVKDDAALRKSTVVGIGAIGLFYLLTLYLGLGAMTSGMLDPTDSNMAVPLLAKSFGTLPFALITAIAFTVVLGTVSGLIMASAGAVAHDLVHNLMKRPLDDRAKVRVAKRASIAVGVIAVLLGIAFERMNVSFLVGWAFNVAASANLPAIVMLLFWKRTTKEGITASIFVGLLSSLGWIFLSGDAFSKLYGLSAASAPMPFNQPGLVTIPLSFATLILVSLVTKKRDRIPVAAA